MQAPSSATHPSGAGLHPGVSHSHTNRQGGVLGPVAWKGLSQPTGHFFLTGLPLPRSHADTPYQHIGSLKEIGLVSHPKKSWGKADSRPSLLLFPLHPAFLTSLVQVRLDVRPFAHSPESSWNCVDPLNCHLTPWLGSWCRKEGRRDLEPRLGLLPPKVQSRVLL